MGLVKLPSSLPVLADSSFFVALFNDREQGHTRCKAAYNSFAGPLFTAESCITEALHLLGHAQAAVEAILTNVRQGALVVPFRLGDCPSEIAHLMSKYADTPCDFADACLIAMANQLSTGDVLTLDSDFKHYRWRRTRKFNMLIPLD
ncbi:MAG: PIN domain-containing protein [Terracidiphilus sp.]|jgi:predicted nucleic acid-binding protein